MSRTPLLAVIVCAVTISLLIAVVGADRGQAQGQLLAAAAKAQITPQGPVWLAGYDGNRRSAAVHDDLWARALVLKSGDQALAIVSVDLLGFPNLYLRRVRELVKAVPADAVLVAATHNHSGPDVIGLWGASETQTGVDQAYIESVVKAVAQVIEDAASKLAPAAVKCAAGDLAGVSKNIRMPDILDRGLTALQAVGDDGKTIATMVNFACHPAIMNTTSVTADFPNWIYQRIEEKAGGVALFVNGALGGMISANVENEGAQGAENWDAAARVGNAIADKALEVLSGAQPAKDVPLALRASAVTVALANPRFEAAIAAGLLPEFRENGKVKTEVAAGAIGRAEFATIPGEAFPAIGLLLKQQMTSGVKFASGITQDELGYIMSREDYGLKLYEYEASMSVGPEMGAALVDALRPLIVEINKQMEGGAPSEAPEVQSIDAWFMNLPQNFNAAAAEGVNVVYYFKVTGAGGGDYTVTVADGKCTSERRKPERSDLTITVSAADAAKIVAGELDPVEAWTLGKVVFDGDFSLAMMMMQLFGL